MREAKNTDTKFEIHANKQKEDIEWNVTPTKEWKWLDGQKAAWLRRGTKRKSAERGMAATNIYKKYKFVKYRIWDTNTGKQQGIIRQIGTLGAERGMAAKNICQRIRNWSLGKKQDTRYVRKIVKCSDKYKKEDAQFFWCVQKTGVFRSKNTVLALFSGSKISHLSTVRA